MPIFKHASFAKFWDVNQTKSMIVDKPARPFDLKRAEVFDCITKAKLMTSLCFSFEYNMDVIVEFYSNLSKSLFDIKSLDYHRGFVRGEFFDFYPSLIDAFLCGEVIVEPSLELDPDVIAAELLGKEGAVWPVTAKRLRASTMTSKYKALYHICNINWIPTFHKTYVNLPLATFLFKIGTGIPVSLGRMVFEFLADHAESNDSSKFIGFPRLLFSFLASRVKAIQEMPKAARDKPPPHMVFNAQLTGKKSSAPPAKPAPSHASSSKGPAVQEDNEFEMPFGPTPQSFDPALSKLMFQTLCLEYVMLDEQIRIMQHKQSELLQVIIGAGGTLPTAGDATQPDVGEDGLDQGGATDSDVDAEQDQP